MIKNLLLAGLGGGIGTMARYACQRWVSQSFFSHFPWGTFAVNIIGCFAIGVFWAISFKSFASNEHWKIFLMTGICGGFTTFSAFTLEGVQLLKSDRLGLFFIYATSSVLLGLAATYLGIKLMR